MENLKRITNTDQRKKMSASLDKRDKKIFKNEDKNDKINFSSGELLHRSKLILGLNNDPAYENKFPISWEFIS